MPERDEASAAIGIGREVTAYIDGWLVLPAAAAQRTPQAHKASAQFVEKRNSYRRRLADHTAGP